MTATEARRVRRSLTELERAYEAGDKAPLETLMRAWKAIKALPPENPDSFFAIGGLHGEPFRGEGATDPSWWGGYCQHGAVLFPSWHRAYLWRLEEALRRVPGCEDVTLPFWDECSQESRDDGVPRALTDETFELDGETIPNPLRSFVLPVAIEDKIAQDKALYSKPKGYETTRYPLSGLVGTEEERRKTEAHNARYKDHAETVALLNRNIKNWLNLPVEVMTWPDGPDKPPATRRSGQVFESFVSCLNAPNYTLFSNTTSASAASTRGVKVTPLESPHNYMHLAVGGFDVPGVFDASPVDGANGDMGENDTAGLDPIFFFHHCFIDYVFWIWQRRHDATNVLTIEKGDPGTKFSSSNPPPVGMEQDTELTLESPLNPFMAADESRPLTTADCVNIESQLGYSYGPGSLDAYATAAAERLAAVSPEAKTAPRTVHVSGIDRSKIRGSFLISTFVTIDGVRRHAGTEAVLSRWHVEGCMNCLNHLEARASFPLAPKADAQPVEPHEVEVEVCTRAGLLGGGPSRPSAAAPLAAAQRETKPPFRVELS